jgi:hypothetical protein
LDARARLARAASRVFSRAFASRRREEDGALSVWAREPPRERNA